VSVILQTGTIISATTTYLNLQLPDSLQADQTVFAGIVAYSPTGIFLPCVWGAGQGQTLLFLYNGLPNVAGSSFAPAGNFVFAGSVTFSLL
jgi:hypothetical protein